MEVTTCGRNTRLGNTCGDYLMTFLKLTELRITTDIHTLSSSGSYRLCEKLNFYRSE